jgi:choline-phosphate cytidylyltransferase
MKFKGKTLFNEDERAEMVLHCRYVDEVVPRCPWIVTPEFVEKHKIDFVVHGEDPCVTADGEDVYKTVKDMGKFRFIKRTEGVSTSDLIMRLLRDYDVYLKRNLKVRLSTVM